MVDKNSSNGNGEDGESFNEMLNDITKDIDFEKVDQENEDESGLEEMSNEDNNGEEEKDETSNAEETKKEK